MKKYTYALLASSLLFFNGCELGDKIEEEAKRIYNKIYDKVKAEYEEYRGEENQDKPRPFEVVYQEDPSQKTPIILSQCSANQAVQYTYFSTPTDASYNFISRTNKLVSTPGGSMKPFWDIRYVNPVSAYIQGGEHPEYPDHSPYTGLDARSGSGNLAVGTSFAEVDPSGSVTQSVCVGGSIAGGALINLNDAPEQYIHYAGPQNTFVYRFDTASHIAPWKTDGTGNLMLQASFDRPVFNNFGGNIGGGVYFNVFMRNKRSGTFLNFVIGVYSAGEAWVKEKRGIQFDPTTNMVHVATVVSDNSWWSTKSPQSIPLQEIVPTNDPTLTNDGQWPEFFRVNISYQNLLVVLQELAQNPPASAAGRDFGQNPAEWEITTLMIQYELQEEGGKALLSGSFHGFEAYISQLPL
jgi:hypothetical protein